MVINSTFWYLSKKHLSQVIKLNALSLRNIPDILPYYGIIYTIMHCWNFDTDKVYCLHYISILFIRLWFAHTVVHRNLKFHDEISTTPKGRVNQELKLLTTHFPLKWLGWYKSLGVVAQRPWLNLAIVGL